MFSVDDDHFRRFASTLEALIADHGEVADKFDHQKSQIDGLIALEDEFRASIVESPLGLAIYEDFILFICEVQKNILDARPFFRERQEVFADGISAALKARNPQALHAYSVNYQFVLFVMAQTQYEPFLADFLKPIADAITRLRRDIMELLLPLGINRARLFYRATPKSHLQHMDMVQIACEGMMSGMDKYRPESGEPVSAKGLRAAMINRISGNLIADYNQTLVHFYPVDKRILYRGNKFSGKQVGEIDYEKLAKDVNEGVDDDSHKTTPADLADLMAASSTISADSSLATNPDAPEPIERFAAPESTRPDVQVEERDAMGLLLEAYDQLAPYEKKLLRLKGVRFDERSLLDQA